jgi:hypothetical protein
VTQRTRQRSKALKSAASRDSDELGRQHPLRRELAQSTGTPRLRSRTSRGHLRVVPRRVPLRPRERASPRRWLDCPSGCRRFGIGTTGQLLAAPWSLLLVRRVPGDVGVRASGSEHHRIGISSSHTVPAFGREPRTPPATDGALRSTARPPGPPGDLATRTGRTPAMVTGPRRSSERRTRLLGIGSELFGAPPPSPEPGRRDSSEPRPPGPPGSSEPFSSELGELLPARLVSPASTRQGHAAPRSDAPACRTRTTGSSEPPPSPSFEGPQPPALRSSEPHFPPGSASPPFGTGSSPSRAGPTVFAPRACGDRGRRNRRFYRPARRAGRQRQEGNGRSDALPAADEGNSSKGPNRTARTVPGTWPPSGDLFAGTHETR